MGIYDVPASLNYVANVTNKSGDIIYIGHSMGTTMFFIYSSIFPKQAQMVKIMVAFAPVAYMTHLRSPIRYIAPFSNDLEVSIINIRMYFIHTYIQINLIFKVVS